MIQSMTAFARKEARDEWGGAIWEIRSINHRYLEMNLRLPEALGSLEPIIREQLKNRLQRGKIDVTLRYQPPTGQGFSINQELVNALLNAQNQVADSTEPALAPVTTADILRWPGVLMASETNANHLQKQVMAVFENTVEELIQQRLREGKVLQQLMLQRLQTMQQEVLKVQNYFPELAKLQREKLLNRFAEANIPLDPNRLEQEMVFFAQKIDVMEEIERLTTHIEETERVLKTGGACGRRLDFLLQELNREANTLGSKSVATDTTRVAVELKVLIEQIREQVQNVE